MEWISKWLDRIMQNAFWQNILSHMQWLDWLAVILIAFGIIYGMKKGFMPILGYIIQLIVMITLTLEFYGRAESMITTYVNIIPPDMMKMAAFVVTGIVCWLGVGLIGQILGKIISAQTSAPLKVLGGAVGGAFYFFLFLSFISQAVLLGPWESLHKAYEKGASYSGVMLARTAPRIHRLVTRPFESVRSVPESEKTAEIKQNTNTAAPQVVTQ